MAHVHVPIGFKIMKESEDKRHKPVSHALVLRFEFYPHRLGGSKEYFLGRLRGYHGCEFRGDVEPVPYTTQIMKREVRRVRLGI